jgi:hypothetical protein
MTKINIRFIVTKKGVYLKQEDVLNYFRELAGTEETDVRNRMEQAINNIIAKGKYDDSETDYKHIPFWQRS